MTDSVPHGWLQVDFGNSALVGKLCRHLPHTMWRTDLTFRIDEYDHTHKMLLVYGPVKPGNRDEEGEIEPDLFWVDRSDVEILGESPSLPDHSVVD